MNYHMFHDSFTGEIEHSGIIDLFPKTLFKKTSQEIWGELIAALKMGELKGSEAPTRPTPSAMTGVC